MVSVGMMMFFHQTNVLFSNESPHKRKKGPESKDGFRTFFSNDIRFSEECANISYIALMHVPPITASPIVERSQCV